MTKILLIEDDERIVRPLKRELEREHYLVDVAGDGEEGWHYLSLAEYDLLILDVMWERPEGPHGAPGRSTFPRRTHRHWPWKCPRPRLRTT